MFKVNFKSFKSLILFVINLTMLFVSGQNQNNNWYFGNNAGITFNNGSITAFNTSQMVTFEGCASVSDPVSGVLLFYTNGLKVWDKNNNVMPNGDGLQSGPLGSATQAVVIVPYPNNPNLYFVFTVDETNNNSANGFQYLIVDMTLNNGLGDVDVTKKNILIQANTTERLTVTKKGDESGYWVIIHERSNNVFKSYSITSSGLNTNPTTSNIGSTHSTVPQTNGDATQGCMKVSQDGKKIAVAIYADNKVEVFDFNNCTGSITNAKTIPTLDNPYGIEFSPDNSKLYYSLFFNAGNNAAFYQVNLQNPSLTPVLVGISTSSNNQSAGSIQLAPDNKNLYSNKRRAVAFINSCSQ